MHHHWSHGATIALVIGLIVAFAIIFSVIRSQKNTDA